MSDINLNLYKIFCVVAESRTYAEASKKLYLTESTISSHITNLEDKLNNKLFYRERRDGLTLTKVGKELYDSIKDKIRDIEFAENSIIQNNDISKAKIAVASPSHIATFYLSKCINKAKQDYPDLRIDIIGVADYKGLIDLLQKHLVDFVIMDIVPNDFTSEMKIKKLKKINNTFVSKEKIEISDIKDLEKYKYILNYENSSSTKKLLETLKNYDVKINADIQADATEIRIEEAKQGQGIGYVMRESVEEELRNEKLYEVQLPIKLPEMNINLVYMEKYLTEVDKIFIKKYLET